MNNRLSEEVSGKFAFDFPLVQVRDQCLAAVAAQDKVECYHVLPDGTPAYQERYGWVGDFVKVAPDTYLAKATLGDFAFHITPDGKPAYLERYEFCSDFHRAGDKFVADVRIGSRVFQITLNGKPAPA